MESFGEKLRRLRREKKMTQLDLARATGCTKSTVVSAELDKTYPSFFNLVCLADVLGVSMDYLAGREDRAAEREKMGAVTKWKSEAAMHLAACENLVYKNIGKPWWDMPMEDIVRIAILCRDVETLDKRCEEVMRVAGIGTDVSGSLGEQYGDVQGDKQASGGEQEDA